MAFDCISRQSQEDDLIGSQMGGSSNVKQPPSSDEKSVEGFPEINV